MKSLDEDTTTNATRGRGVNNMFMEDFFGVYK